MRLAFDRAHVRVPATSANLGPGFDSFGLAMPIWDDVQVEAVTGSTTVHVTGYGADNLPAGEDHLIIRALRVALDYVDAPQAGFVLHCRNRIPHGRGLGSSAAATVAGLLLARGLISDPDALGDDCLLTLAAEFEGHPDNAAPAILGGATVAYMSEGRARAARIPLGDVSVTAFVPEEELSTSRSRGALPAHVPHADAAFNAARAGLLTLALSGQSELLAEATEDRLHQDYRADVMPKTARLLGELRSRGAAAVISGAGPSVLVLGDLPDEQVPAAAEGWHVIPTGIAAKGAHLVNELR